MRRRRDNTGYQHPLGTVSGYAGSSSTFRHLTPLRTFEDNRVFHPAGPLRPAVSLRSRLDARIVYRKRMLERSNANVVSHMVGFAVPEVVVKCIRRKQRREVIHAKKLTGKGASASFRRFTDWSKVYC